ncbi:bifunctional NAD(P)/FAD-dependent oxidoreductase/class I SAM-dependent methyltransferase [Microbacterium sp. T2.11-28]|uniref:bifunctional NAD(P)/FAD-dependent oxidoreductase/class I SAM-dependent methyltransferase n=1 Tax=Microbacterium sp. T2.11-28 TaxID=3041169 RepID=UPI00247799E6|nr:bifunctional NAD(P)/FAD-dependent oxidoreductase/class I SAM-dependent methyltransferase [Microbacterium sp. T2.11-28]CAI9388287.1 Ubiquinone biosynthesis O-methyltransferase, mitochondrial [Microbacterium sp. T2.11-28]
MDIREWDAVVIGGAVAGLSAAQMLGRARRRTLVIDGGAPRNRFAAHMHGVLGHDGAEPAELLARGRREAEAYGVVVESATVTEVSGTADGLRIVRADGGVEHARAVVVATGIRDALPDIDGLAAHWGTSVLHCPYCHGWEVGGRRLGVIATSPASVHQIDLVRQWSEDVTAFTALAGPLAPEVRERWDARGIRIVERPVRSVGSGDGRLTGLVDDAGTTHPVDAVFVAPAPEVALEFLSGLRLARADQPGAPLAVDATGATSHPRIWAAGNVAAPFGNVPLSMGAGSMAGAAVNAALVAEDAAHAVAARRDARAAARNAHWEERYAEGTRFWSGRVNETTAAVARTLPRGTALEIGCGEGADAIWLAEQGWTVTAVDVSPTAISRARVAAAERGLTDTQVRFETADAAGDLPPGPFDLVVSSFLHSWEHDFPRIDILRRAAARVAPGGRLLAVSHAAVPPWSAHDDAEDHPVLLTPAQELALLGLDPAVWTVELAEVRARETAAPDGRPAHLDDGVLLLRRA